MNLLFTIADLRSRLKAALAVAILATLVTPQSKTANAQPVPTLITFGIGQNLPTAFGILNTDLTAWFNWLSTNSAFSPNVLTNLTNTINAYSNSAYASLTQTNDSRAVSLLNPVNAFAGNGLGLTNLDATKLTNTIADARHSANVPLLNANNVFTGTTTATGSFTGTFTGNGAALTSVPINTASPIFTVSVTMTNGGTLQYFFYTNGAVNISGPMTASNYTGGAGGLTGIPASQLIGSLPAISGASLTGVTDQNAVHGLNNGSEFTSPATFRVNLGTPGLTGPNVFSGNQSIVAPLPNQIPFAVLAATSPVVDVASWADHGGTIRSGVQSNFVYWSPGFRSTASDATLAITATGITNSFGKGATAYVTCTAVTSFLTNAIGQCVKTNTTATYVDTPFHLQANGCIAAASGLSGTLIPE